ncbi:MAG: Spy/CpxP family protein refolding chaperone [Betaproteobacteria bacterium]|nr:Spy/CpxP family protein refolding chaperone [Betaproteobacteria bacterium]
MNRKTIVTFLAAASLALGAGVASAQGWGGYHHGGDCYGGKYTGKWSEEDLKERMAARHEKLKERLKITPEQETAWKTFNEQMAAIGESRMAARPDPAEFAKLTTPERMEKRLELSRKFQDAMDKRLAVLKTFYASLTAEQKQIFDDLHSPRWRDGKRGWHKKGW